MVGGTVIDVTHKANGLTNVNVQGTGCEKNDTRVIEVLDSEWKVSEGDSCWWHAHRAFFDQKAEAILNLR